ncbi:ArsR/SmtB family transcription factor [Aquabacter cavernae]|uniref:ArsR/SmtB family transcription factor n=1 Tax=Aquabacter cavernae TaxID=2496029 RepID=UPI000F8F14A5|nr:metalloregulator ArsR/SmtB family transcription factor [Aquabacter cavernae]
MESNIAIDRLSALAQDSRLAIFRLLVKAGEEGVAAGDVARALDIPANTLSSHLAILSKAGLVMGARRGRSIIYVADIAAMGELLVYLLEDCCGGHPELCAPVAMAARATACCTPERGGAA